MPKFIATLFIIAKARKQPKYLSKDEWIKIIYIYIYTYIYTHTYTYIYKMEYYSFTKRISSVEFSPQLCLTLCDPMDCSMPGFPVHHQHLEFTQTHVHRVGDATQPSLLQSSLSPPAFNLSDLQGLFQ